MKRCVTVFYNVEDGESEGGAGKKTVIVLAATNTPWDLDEVFYPNLFFLHNFCFVGPQKTFRKESLYSASRFRRSS